MKWIFILFFLPIYLLATHVGNPASITLFEKGTFLEKDLHVYLRSGYIYDYIYRGKFEEKEKTESSFPTDIKFFTQSAIATINLYHILEAFGTLGTSELIIDETNVDQRQLLFTESAFSWSAGGKLLLFKKNGFVIAADGKFFQSKLPADYILLNKMLADFIGEFFYFYEEIQGSLGASLTTNFISPYIGVTYLHATLDPAPLKGGVIQFSEDDFSDYPGTTFITRQFWGLFVGVTMMSSENFAVNLEGRFFDQNSYNVSASFQF